jgi:hypothetical protein
MYKYVIKTEGRREALFFIKLDERQQESRTVLTPYQPIFFSDLEIRNDLKKAIAMSHKIHVGGNLDYQISLNYWNEEDFYFLQQWMDQRKTRYIVVDQDSNVRRIISEKNDLWGDIILQFIRLSLTSPPFTNLEFRELENLLDNEILTSYIIEKALA